MERPIRIVLADDHPVVRIGVRNMLTEKDGFLVVGEASDGDEAITQTLELEPDILLLDVSMPRLPGPSRLALPKAIRRLSRCIAPPRSSRSCCSSPQGFAPGVCWERRSGSA